jgi:hypothetical protein
MRRLTYMCFKVCVGRNKTVTLTYEDPRKLWPLVLILVFHVVLVSASG